ncbi:MAG: glucoamylase family protein [Bacteroidota bacterium]
MGFTGHSAKRSYAYPLTRAAWTFFLLALIAPYVRAQSPVSEQRRYMLNDFDNNTTVGFNDFYGDHGMWNYNGGIITPTFEIGPGAHACLRLAYDLTAASTAGGWWERLGYDYENPNTPVVNLNEYDSFQFLCRNADAETTRFYVEFVQGNFEKSKRVEITGITNSWQERSISLSSALSGFNLARMSQISIVLESAHVTPKTGVLYFDDFCFVGKPEGYTTDDQFLDLLCRKAFRYFVSNAHPQSGLVRDIASYRSVSSIAGVGFQLAALGIGAERQWMTRSEAALRTKKILTTLWTAPQEPSTTGALGYKGFFYHIVDIATGARSGNSELSSIDASLCFAGVIFAREYFDDPLTTAEQEIRALADSIVGRIDWRWMLDTPSNHFFMAWKPESGFDTPRWDYYTDEASLISILAVASGTVDTSVFYAWKREEGSYGGHTFIRTWWGSLFTYFFAQCWFPFEELGYEKHGPSSVNWWDNSVAAANAARAYCSDLGYILPTYSDSSWGLTACFGPNGYNGGSPKSYGCPPLADPPANHDGTIAPYGAGSCIPFFSKQADQNRAIATLKNYYHHYPRLWGIYGLKDAYNLGTSTDTTDDWYADEYVSIDAGPMLLMIENYRSGLVWNTMRKNARIRQALHSLFEWTSDGVKGSAASAPTGFALFQNYPNPFNPTTVIGYTVGGARGQGLGASNVWLGVYDVLGRVVAKLVNEKKAPGSYTVEFDGTNLASGVYFYRLQAGTNVETRRMVLMR